MSTLTIQLSDEQAARLKSKAEELGQTVEKVVQAQIEITLSKYSEKSWGELIGSIEGPADLSTRKGYSTQAAEMTLSPEPFDEPWMKYIGCVEGPEDLSTREGFGPR
jgi:hypothetical protein